MRVGTIILSKDNCYITNDGQLPKRPEFDKYFLTTLCRGRKIYCSDATLATLPDSIKKCADCNIQDPAQHDINLGIKTLFLWPPDILFIVRSEEKLGSKYKLTPEEISKDYTCVYRAKDLEIYIKELECL